MISGSLLPEILDMRLDPELLEGPPETGARVLALARLADAEDALARLLPGAACAAGEAVGVYPLPWRWAE